MNGFAGRDPRILGMATAVPDYPLPQSEVVQHAAETFGNRFRDFERLRPVFENTGIEMRYSVRPFDWFHETQDWQKRTEAYLDGATRLFIEAARNALEVAGVAASEIDTVVTVSSTGIATPSLEARAHSALGFRPDIHRVPVFGLGCAGGVSGLAIASRAARAAPGSKVLLVAVEICTLAFRSDEMTKSNLVATALFGDGGAAVVLSTDANEGAGIAAAGEHLWPDTLNVMGWQVDPVGFGAIFSASIPDIVSRKMRPAVETFLAKGEETIDDLASFAFHPGGAKVIAVLEQAFDLSEGELSTERQVLKEFGNMSAPTALFVLQRRLAEGMTGPCLLAALGPGFTGSFVRIDA